MADAEKPKRRPSAREGAKPVTPRSRRVRPRKLPIEVEAPITPLTPDAILREWQLHRPGLPEVRSMLERAYRRSG